MSRSRRAGGLRPAFIRDQCCRALLLVGGLLASAGAHAADVTVTIAGAGPVGGVRVAVFGDAASFAAHTNPVAVATAAVLGTQARLTFHDLRPGRYAIAAFQDVNGTGRLATNFLGMPTEPYGFSNDAKALLRQPSFEQAAVALGVGPLALLIHLR